MTTPARTTLHLSIPPPPAQLSAFPTRQYPAGTTLFRAHRHGKGPRWFSHSGEGRFDLTAPNGTCYLAESALVPLLETWGGMQIIPDYVAAQRDISTVELDDTITVADFTSNKAVRFGVTSEVFTIVDYARTQRWATALYDAGFGGIRYWARHDLAHRAGAIALFGPADPSKNIAEFTVLTTDRVSDRPDLVRDLEDDTGIRILPLPPPI